MTVRPAEAADAAAVAALEAAVFSDSWTEGDVLAMIHAPYALSFVAQTTRQTAADAPPAIVGYVLATAIAPEGEILRIAVCATARRLGIGERLLRAYIDAAAKRGVTSVFLEVRGSHVPPRALYEKLGFVSIGQRRAYYRHPTDDAVLMRLHVQDASTCAHTNSTTLSERQTTP